MKMNIPENILHSPERYTLTIRVHPVQYSFSLHNPLEDGSFFYQVFPLGKNTDPFGSFQQFFFENDCFSQPFRQIKMINHTPVFTFVPSLIFNEQDKQSYFDFNFSEYSGKILTQSLHSPALTLLHVLPQAVYDFFQRSFVGVEYIHHLAPQIAYCGGKSRIVNANKIYANVQAASLDVLVFSHNQFLMGNSFEIKDNGEYLYYLLLIWQQFELDQTRDFLYITGDAGLRASLLRRLQDFIRNVVPLNLVPEGHFLHVATSSVPFEMTSLTLCEL